MSPVPAAAKRPGPLGGRRIRPLPEELRPLPQDLISIPLPERVAVDLPADVTDAVTGPELPDTEAIAQAKKCGAYTETDIRPLGQQ